MLSKRFQGWYFKQHSAGRTLALIPGRAERHAFIQVVTDAQAYNINYPLATYQQGQGADMIVDIAGNRFSRSGIMLDIHSPELDLSGCLRYGTLQVLRGDIMGPFRFLPMECRHTVISMQHKVCGQLLCNGEAWGFDGGQGYIEGDSGHSFPSSYAWAQCNDAAADVAVMAAVARIPLAGISFCGCICAVSIAGREYRLATYRGARVKACQRQWIEIVQGRLRLVIEASPVIGHALAAPQSGEMRRIVHEAPACDARFSLWDGKQLLLDHHSHSAGYEFVAAEDQRE